MEPKKTKNSWRATSAILLVVLLGLSLAFIVTATHNANHGADPTPTPTTSSAAPAPTGSPPPVPPSGSYFTQEGGKVSPTSTLEYDWQRVEIRATITGVHFNINQDAKAVDSSADDWTQVFHLNAPFRDEDYVSFCAPQTTVTIQVRDRDYAQTIYEGTLTQVPPCQ